MKKTEAARIGWLSGPGEPLCAEHHAVEAGDSLGERFYPLDEGAIRGQSRSRCRHAPELACWLRAEAGRAEG